MIGTIAAVLLLMVMPVTGSAQGSAADTAAIAAAIATELRDAGHRLVVSDEGIGGQVAAVLGQAAVSGRADPVCPWTDGAGEDGGVLVSIRLMELSGSAARLHVDTSCRTGSPRFQGRLTVVRYELKKLEGSWQVVGRQPLHRT